MTTITLPPLPYDYDALEPHISKETLEFHHDKHHNTYVVNLVKAIEGTDLEGKELDDIIKATAGDASKQVFLTMQPKYGTIHSTGTV